MTKVKRKIPRHHDGDVGLAPARVDVALVQHQNGLDELLLLGRAPVPPEED
eukprot:CAMPEP_0181111390 /NCGR_PEP_ID=MMETSP1071-20121207/19245_1 /TAXON_ID=35127 /ORGANISM="Thalassiosira sp., Strain NH16" /LENGTH=50 /DNA_ID=CAMNT_0023195271 /DNA_START=65 /DNA_END=217 /DNA_ORIENTATION=-